ncbi:MAG: RIP metalloprotease RseP [Bacteroidetes bacterium]|nr:RIP metalloprotease RseP [Bacteroidota bacterium]HET6244392.1 RIP metalloprotease RseP [Bacteroidia bacterium]
MDGLIQAAQLILSLSILIVLHELGHFIPAKLFKTRVEKFYLFFDPWFSIFKFKKGDTEYGMGWLPLGGYVKISGMIDESMDKEQLAQEPQPWEFRSKPAWQRLIIMIGGVTVNFLLAIFIYIMMLFIIGEEYLPAENVTYGIHADSLAMEMGLEHGDNILAVDGKQVEDFQRILPEIIINEAKSLTIQRNGEVMELEIPGEVFKKLVSTKATFITPRIPYVVQMVAENSVAEESGIKEGDRFVALNGQETEYFQEFREQMSKHKGEKITVTVIRDNAKEDIEVQLTETGLLGIQVESDIADFFEVKKINYNLASAIPAGVNKAFTTFEDYIRSMKLLFSPNVNASESVGGFITIGKAFSPQWDWVRFWSFTAFLSIILAIMNILPIPALDGGHVMFLLYEVVTGRKPNEKFLEYAQYAGMILLLSLLLFANGNDILKLFK